ncbi:Gypsy retrotransposon integrase-like protein 1 [Rhizina undulata]
MTSAAHLSSAHSSPSSFEEEAAMLGTTNWQHVPPPVQTTPPSIAGSVADGSTTSSVPTKATLPLQKRRRVTRACDECRRKKIKCDGKQPCTHCTVYSYECTYDQPSNRRRNPAPQYIEALENRVQRAEGLLRILLPDVDVTHPNFDLGKLLPQMQAAAAGKMAREGLNAGFRPPHEFEAEKEALLESMVEAAGNLDIDETGHMDFIGHSSGVAFLNHLNKQFSSLLGDDSSSNAWKMIRSSAFPKVFDSPASSANSPLIVNGNLPDTSLLPSREMVAALVSACLDDACVLMCFVHRPTFDAMVQRIYDVSPEMYEEQENAFLPLLYLALAVGCLFVNDAEKWGIDNPVTEGSKYFNVGRRMIEITDCRDINSIQTVILMIIFLQSSARMSTCYSFVGIALSASVRMGLHRTLPESRFDPVERETRKRIFWTVRKMDTYVAALLGLPKGIADEDIDQEMPLEVDDEYIIREAILPQPENTISTNAVANAHTKLLRVMAKVVKYIYPLKGVEASMIGKGFGYSVSSSKLGEIERDLGTWLDELPMQLRPGGDSPGKFLKAQYLLKMAFSHVQMMLYRPFLHYISRPKKKGSDERPYASAANCVSVSRKIIHTADEMRAKGILNGAYWFTMYTNFFAVITLLYYVIENQTDPTALSILNDAETGWTLLAGLKDKSLAACRCSAALSLLFEQMPPIKAALEKDMLAARKKRSRAGSQGSTGADDQMSMDGQRSPGTNFPVESNTGPQRRISTLPIASDGDVRRQSTPIQIHRTNFNPTQDPMNRRSSYELYMNAGYISSIGPSDQQQQQPMSFQAQLSGNGLPDLNTMMFPSSDPYNYANPQNMGQQQFKQEQDQDNTPSPESMFGRGNGNPYDSLEVQLFGPLPPYLLQGQHHQMGNEGTGGGMGGGPQNMNTDGETGSISSSIQGQNLMASVGGGNINLEGFFGDEWDEMLMQQSFRQ